MWLSPFNTWDTVIKTGCRSPFGVFKSGGTCQRLRRTSRRESFLLSLAADSMEARTLLLTRSFFCLPTLITSVFKMNKLCIVPPVLLPEVLCASSKKMLPLQSSASYRWYRETRGMNTVLSEGGKSVTYRLQQELNTQTFWFLFSLSLLYESVGWDGWLTQECSSVLPRIDSPRKETTKLGCRSLKHVVNLRPPAVWWSIKWG